MEPILTLISAIITLATTVLGVFEEKKDIEKTEKSINNQDQKFNNITTQGDNSAININATQIQQSVIVKNHQEYKIKDEKFKENLVRLKGYNKFFLVICPVIIAILYYMKKLLSIDYGIKLSTLIVCSYGISIFFRYFYKRYLKKNKSCGDENDLISKFIRKIEFTIFPWLLFLVFCISIFFSTVKIPNDKSIQYSFTYMYSIMFLVSCYAENLIFQFVIGNNMWRIKPFLKKFFLVIFILIVCAVFILELVIQIS